ncbi:SDR family NAD(P)-dependent oxidoreductase [Methylobacterium platani]|uniref:Oxidoreductase n=2 Tax=Methylobacterium platani TaxID=427683 RepID=A0A179SH70_9HYPH|nr:SDR family NAD(P)-dependent oxidoreductase [Methylobacterium platani]KMO10628.1 oxidoreductase [Methylobacterium platani JCM 14648]OAS25847.1 oxidoreductase [Methylobacterium platani]
MSDTPLPGPLPSAKPLADRIAVVTGASRGIGRAASLALAAAGAHVIAVARTQGALEELDDAVRAAGGSATLVPLDLCDYDAIDRLGAAIHERWGRLDVLVGNAGVLGKLMPLGHVDPKVWSTVMDVNVTANWRLIRSLDPLLRRSEAGRAVFVTSGAASSCRAYWGPYAVSKAALEAMVRTYAAETATTPVRAMLLNPGPLRTAMRKAAMPGEDPETLRTPEDLAPHIVRLASPDWTESGSIFDFPTGRILTPQKPA